MKVVVTTLFMMKTHWLLAPLIRASIFDTFYYFLNDYNHYYHSRVHSSSGVYFTLITKININITARTHTHTHTYTHTHHCVIILDCLDHTGLTLGCTPKNFYNFSLRLRGSCCASEALI